MAKGFRLRKNDGTVIWSTTDIGAVFVERLVIPVGSSSNKTYNADARYSGRTVLAIQVGGGSHTWSTTTSGGWPVVTWVARTGTSSWLTATELLVFLQ